MDDQPRRFQRGDENVESRPVGFVVNGVLNEHFVDWACGGIAEQVENCSVWMADKAGCATPFAIHQRPFVAGEVDLSPFCFYHVHR